MKRFGMSLNRHQQNAMAAIIQRLEILGEEDAVALAKAVIYNDHAGMLGNIVYQSRRLTTTTRSDAER